MIEIPSIATILSGTQLPPIANVAPVAVIPTAVPQQLLNLFRQMEVTGTIALPPDSQTVTLTTAQGNLTLTLPQQANAQQEKIQQQLIALFQTQRPVTVILQPGSPPTQAILLLPALMQQPQESRIAAQQDRAVTRAALNMPHAPISTPLTAIVLPQNILLPQGSTPSAAAPLPNAGTLGTGQTSAPQNPLQSEQVLFPTAQQGTAAYTSNILPRLINLLTTGQTQPAAQNAPTTTALNNISPQQPVRTDADALTQTPPTAVPPQLLTAGKEISVRIINPVLLPPSVSIPSDALPAIVSGHGSNGEAIIRLDTASLYIKNAPTLPTGSTVYVTLEELPHAINPATLPARDQDNVALALQNLLDDLTQIDPALARQLVQTTMFQPTQGVPSPLLLFMNAFRQGGVSGWLGQDVTDSLSRAGKYTLFGKVVSEMKRAAQPVRDTMVGEWQSYPVPVYFNNHVYTINFYVHDNSARDEDSGRISTTNRAGYIRFLIELNMTKLGPVQIDGLIHQRKLDILVRSASPLPSILQNDLKQSYIQSMQAIDYNGNLDFQTGRQHWLYMQQRGMKSLLT